MNPVLVATAIASGTTIYMDISGGFSPGNSALVQASVPITFLRPAGGFPTRPFLTGSGFPDNGTYVVQAGATFLTWLPEATALQAAGVATVVGVQ